MRQVWTERIWGQREKVPLLNMEQIVKPGKHPDSEPYGLLKISELPLEKISTERRVDLLACLQTTDDVLIFRNLALKLGNPLMTLATMAFPLERGDRPKPQGDWEEMVLIETLVSDLAGAGVRRMIRGDTHSPAFSLFALMNNIAVIDVSPLPLMLQEAIKSGLLIKETPLVAVTADYGSRERGSLVTDLARDCGFNMAEPVMGNKSKSEGKTEIFIEPADQARIKGYTAIVSEDILATGGTLNELYIKLLAAGVTSVIVMVTYPIVAANALQYLGNKDGLTIITTDGRTPQHDILQTQNFIQIPVQSNFAQLLQLDRDGVDLWSEEGQRAMAQWGFCLAPWLTHI